MWLAVFLLVPLVGVAAISFLSRGEYGQAGAPLTLDNYRRLAGYSELGFDPLYPQIMLRSLVLGGVTTALTLLAAVPLALFIARLPPRMRAIALTLVVIPFWTNLLIRTYAWQILLAPESPLSRIAAALGWIGPGHGLFPGQFAVITAMVCDYLPFMVLPVYASAEKIDWTLAEAAADLGANARQVFWHAVVPQLLAGLRAGALLVFLPATGQFVIPDLLGGARTVLLGNAIQQQFGQSRDWPFGSALAVAALLVMFAAVAFRPRRVDFRTDEPFR